MGFRFFGKKERYEIVSVEECSSCGMKIKRQAKSGDFVYAIVGRCKKCNSVLRIAAVYKEKL